MDQDTGGISLANAGNAALFESVFKAHFKNLHAYACSILRDEATAEEMVQQVFYRLWERREEIDVRESVTGYLYRAVHNDCLNYLKHAGVKAAYRTHALHTGSEEHGTDHLALKELQQRIDTAMNELPEQCRAVFQMSRFEDLKYREIADKLDISVKTVETHMGKALRYLRTKLSDYLPLIVLFINVKNLLQ
ncbi:MAG: RNA polymerase sigma-70 factor [Bacteroidota bacterium]